MIKALEELSAELCDHGGHLYLFKGKSSHVLDEILLKARAQAVYSNQDYTPFSKVRDAELQKICLKHDCSFITTHDALLINPNDVLTTQATSYSKFSAFYNKAHKLVIAEPQKKIEGSFYTTAIPHQIKNLKDITIEKPKSLAHAPTRKAGLKILKNIKQFSHYAHTRDFPRYPTTMLSAHLKFGTLSIRETYHAIKKELGLQHALVRQLYWRDFFTYITHHYPRVFGHAFQEKHEGLSWSKDRKAFARWCSGQTGFPIVDAGMRQLIATGFMHNRVRLITASFLVKDLHIDWRWGEKFFAQHLTDYDPAVNNGNWQWVASTGCDSQPYFRIFNPWLQQKKFDPECTYIKEWVPELRSLSAKMIHQLASKNAIQFRPADYPEPIIDHEHASAVAKEQFKSVYTRK